MRAISLILRWAGVAWNFRCVCFYRFVILDPLWIFIVYLSLYNPFPLFPPKKGGHKGCLDTNIEGKGYEVQVISGTR